MPYVILGPVQVDTRSAINVGAALRDALFRSPVAVSIQRTPNATVRDMLALIRDAAILTWPCDPARNEADEQDGGQLACNTFVDAVINMRALNRPTHAHATLTTAASLAALRRDT